jgi:hypothetical protein
MNSIALVEFNDPSRYIYKLKLRLLHTSPLLHTHLSPLPSLEDSSQRLRFTLPKFLPLHVRLQPYSFWIFFIAKRPQT